MIDLETPLADLDRATVEHVKNAVRCLNRAIDFAADRGIEVSLTSIELRKLGRPFDTRVYDAICSKVLK
jgi:hypothetical protein